MLAAVARWIASSERNALDPICIAAGAVRLTSIAASKLDTRRGQRMSSRRNAVVSASTTTSLTSADESRYATGELAIVTWG